MYNERTISTEASLFDRIKSRVVTRECLKLVASPAHNRDMRVTPPVFFRLFLLFPFFFHVRSESQTRAREYAAGDLLDDAEVTRPKSHIRACTSVSNDAIPSDSPT